LKPGYRPDFQHQYILFWSLLVWINF